MLREAAVKDRNDDKGDEGGDGKAPGHGDAKAPPEVCALSGSPGHGEHTKDGGEGGHEDRPQTASCSGYGGFPHRYAPLLQEDGVVNEHNTVFHHNTKQDYYTHHTHHTYWHPSVNHASKRYANKGERNGEHNHKRSQEGFKLGCHDHVHKDHN